MKTKLIYSSIFLCLIIFSISCENKKRIEEKYIKYTEYFYDEVLKKYKSGYNNKQIESYVSSIFLYDGYAYIIDYESNVVYHPNPSIIGTDLKSKFGGKLPDWISKMLKEKQGTFKYVFNNDEKIVSYFDMPNIKQIFICTIRYDSIKRLPDLSEVMNRK